MRFLLIHPDRIDRGFCWSALPLFAGLAGMILCRLTPQFYGIMTSVFLMMLGACGGVFRAWRTERGLWMLAVVFLCMTLPTWLMFVASQFVPSMRGTIPNPWQVDADCVGATLVAGQVSRVLVSVTVYNWRLASARAA